MASSKEYLDFVLEQLSLLSGITYRAMMGEYIIYYYRVIIGGIYDNRLLIKSTKSALKFLSNAPMEIPYPNAKPMIVVNDIENRELLANLFNVSYNELRYNQKGKIK